MKRVSIDLETMGNGPASAIVSIGACDVDGPGVFYRTVDLESSIQAGLKVDASTIVWWLQQSDAARQALQRAPVVALASALWDLAQWLVQPPPDAPYATRGATGYTGELWAYPASFDLVILENAYRAVGYSVPWHYRSGRCLRTLGSLRPDVPKAKAEVTHDALSDAQAQAKWLLDLLDLDA